MLNNKKYFYNCKVINMFKKKFLSLIMLLSTSKTLTLFFDCDPKFYMNFDYRIGSRSSFYGSEGASFWNNFSINFAAAILAKKNAGSTVDIFMLNKQR